MQSNNFEKALVAVIEDALHYEQYHNRLDTCWRDQALAALKAIEDRDREEEARPSIKEFIETAQRIHGKDGECEIDEDAVVSYSDDHGAYVQAWVWVYDTDVDPEKYSEDEP